MKINIADWISLSRIFLAFLISYSIFTKSDILFFTSFFLALLSDKIDGIVARTLKIDSEIGKKFDNYIDFTWTNICFIAHSIKGTISHYFFLIYLIPISALIFVKIKNKKVSIFNIINLNLRKFSLLIYILSVFLIFFAYFNLKIIVDILISCLIILLFIFSIKSMRIKLTKHV